MTKNWNEYFRYDPDTGSIYWLDTRPDHHFKNPGRAKFWRKLFGGRRISCVSKGGYVCVRLGRDLLYAHRIVYEMHFGSIPTDRVIDHDNRIRTDNRIENLRLATRSENARNTGAHRDNASGFKGVTRCALTGMYRAIIMVDGVKHELGRWPTPQIAHSKYAAAAAELHGEFARTA